MADPSAPHDHIPGARPGPVPFTADDFDIEFSATAKSPLLWRLTREAAGDEYPEGTEPWSDTTVWLLDRLAAALSVGPDDVFADLACGRGGPGLWLARSTGARLVGVDWSDVAVRQAAERTAQFVDAGRATFQVGTLEHTGLDDRSVDGAICIDAFFFAGDRVAAAAEVHRILRPGGVFLFTATEVAEPKRPMDVPDWSPILAAGGLEPLGAVDIPGANERNRRTYELWLEHLDELRAEVGDKVADDMREEAETVGARLHTRRPVLVAARRPT